MRLFAPDLFRNFGLGFVLGALVVVIGVSAADGHGTVASPARAAEIVKVPSPSQDFVIPPARG